MGPRARLETAEKRKISCPMLRTELQFFACPALSLVTILTRIYRIQITEILLTEEEEVQK
jgi:hypothetical protein